MLRTLFVIMTTHCNYDCISIIRYCRYMMKIFVSFTRVSLSWINQEGDLIKPSTSEATGFKYTSNSVQVNFFRGSQEASHELCPDCALNP